MLKDGEKRTFPMMMRDAAPEVIFISITDEHALHRPGARFSDAAARRHVEEVYLDEKRKLQDAWRTPPVADIRGQQPGDQCTINEQPGHLNHRLECVPDKRQDAVPGPVSDPAAAQKIKDEAYAAMCRELEDAWRR
jgi:hypothetical protein